VPERRPMSDDSVTVVLTTELLSDGSAALRRELQAVVLSGARVIVLDLAGTSELSSAVVAVALGMHRICRSRGGGLVLRNPGRRAEDLLRRSGLAELLVPPRERGLPPSP
jgi:anti-sigma B factor antagonist